jgi:hypothetical protein
MLRIPRMIFGSAATVADRSPPPSCSSTTAPGLTLPRTARAISLAVAPGAQSRGSTSHSTTRKPSARVTIGATAVRDRVGASGGTQPRVRGRLRPSAASVSRLKFPEKADVLPAELRVKRELVYGVGPGRPALVLEPK